MSETYSVRKEKTDDTQIGEERVKTNDRYREERNQAPITTSISVTTKITKRK